MNTYLNDNVAMVEVAKGDLKAYRYLFDHHFADLCNFLLIYLHDKNLAEELALDIFAYVWEKREDIEIKSSFRNYLFTAAKNQAVSYFRKQQKNFFTDLGLEAPDAVDPISAEYILENEELQQMINNAIDSLPKQSKRIYQMAWEQNLSYKEIADELGLSVKTVENHVGIALRKLREKLRPYYKQIFAFWIISNFF
ncbi:RNA polymerase sigma-70 factor [uncultured Sunxiuqinia sp.]|uniref:RNA polymerase sigma-70 factor n=1 Tax=uncultured Sunxiuqinia sp. TaxID=1573825 RepID=UPI002615D0DC|nr:RNA polymerase sigma-70 factor [uncultured Sunxiuqinia sp.]